MITARIFAVLAAMFLVIAAGIAALTPLGMVLGRGLEMVDRGSIEWLHGHSASWVWTWIEMPFLVRPLWLIPVCLGVVCAGVAASVNLGRASPSRRRRS